jgi:EAL and modified HD-GYP domain-containing signal transduction protein
MLDAPMAPLLDQLPLTGDVRAALLDRPSPLRPVLTYVQRYERGDWTACILLGRNLGLAEATASERYHEAVAWATTVLTDGSRHSH